MSVLRIWLYGSAAIILAILVWTLAPVLFFILLLTAALGVVSAIMIGLARALQAWREGRWGR